MTFVRFQVEITTAGAAQFALPKTDGLAMWIDGQPIDLSHPKPIELPVGRRTVLLAIERDKAPSDLTVEMPDAPGSTIRAQLVGGK